MATNKKTTNDDDQGFTTQTLTPEQQAVYNRVLAETAEWETITEDEMNDFSLSISPLDLKHNFPEAFKAQNERLYAFRWCERTDKRIDELTKGGHPITRWKICTRLTCPFLDKYIDKTLGCIARLDQILLFRPWDRHMIEKNAKFKLAEAHANSGKPENIATRRASDKIEAWSGPEYKIGSRDDIQYEDFREDIGDLIVEE